MTFFFFFPSLSYFVCRHTLWGYWNGINPDSTLHSKYQTIHVKRSHGKVDNLIIPQNISRFYNDFYTYLKSQGISLVKVDFQASFDLLEDNEHYMFWKDYQEALSANSEAFFDSRVVYCMAHTPNLIFENLLNEGVWNRTIR